MLSSLWFLSAHRLLQISYLVFPVEAASSVGSSLSFRLPLCVLCISERASLHTGGALGLSVGPSVWVDTVGLGLGLSP